MSYMLVLLLLHYTDLSVITYQFTPCNITGMLGPTFSQCSSYYKAIGSPIYLDGLLNDSPQQQDYPGGQGFVFPRTGWYNITVAGAAGGRGLCNPEKGKGVVASGRLYMQKGVNDSVLVMVGQQGRGPCDVYPTHPFCELEVSNATNAAECYSQWINQTSATIRQYVGGGSGGGASMIWPSNSSGHFESSNTPFVVSGGGGGTSVRLNYGTFILPPNYTVEEYYIYVINGNYKFAGHTGLGVGVSGNRPEGINIPTAGGGGGFSFVGQLALPIDGKSISRPRLFARGGVDCAEFHSTSVLVPFNHIVGGFGGGGGGCREGGGGAGFTGGSVVASRADIPGEGGFSRRIRVTEVLELPPNGGDGYVNIVPSDCGCADQCQVYREEAKFDCICNSSRLAPDGFDCFSCKLHISLHQQNFSKLSFSNFSCVYKVASIVHPVL